MHTAHTECKNCKFAISSATVSGIVVWKLNLNGQHAKMDYISLKIRETGRLPVLHFRLCIIRRNLIFRSFSWKRSGKYEKMKSWEKMLILDYKVLKTGIKMVQMNDINIKEYILWGRYWFLLKISILHGMFRCNSFIWIHH